MHRTYLHTPRLVIGTTLLLSVYLVAALPLSQKAANSAARDAAPSSSVSALQGDRVALKLYYSASRKDNFTTATAEGERDARAAGYRYVRTEGYLYPDEQQGTVPLRLFYSDARGDNYTTATGQGEDSAKAAGYRYVRTEGYLFPDEGGGSSGGGGGGGGAGGGGGVSGGYIGCFADESGKDLNGYHWKDDKYMTVGR